MGRGGGRRENEMREHYWPHIPSSRECHSLLVLPFSDEEFRKEWQPMSRCCPCTKGVHIWHARDISSPCTAVLYSLLLGFSTSSVLRTAVLCFPPCPPLMGFLRPLTASCPVPQKGMWLSDKGLLCSALREEYSLFPRSISSLFWRVKPRAWS